MTAGIPTASQTIGPFFRVGLWRPEWSDLLQGADDPAAIRIEGTVVDGDGAPVADALVELWQADAEGRYGEGAFRGFGRCGTDAEGRYAFRTVFPGAVADDGVGVQAPHVTLVVFARGLLHHLMTRVYFGDRAAENAADPILNAVPADARETLVAARGETGSAPVYTFDIRLQGERETVFFAV